MEPIININLFLINLEENALIALNEIVKNCLNNNYKLLIKDDLSNIFGKDHDQVSLYLLMLLRESKINIALSKEQQELATIEMELIQGYSLKLKIYPIKPYVVKNYEDGKTDIDTSFYLSLSLNMVENLAIQHMLAENF